MQATILKESFGKTPNGKKIDLFTFQNEAGGIVQITNYGGIIVSAKMPDHEGNLGEITLGFDTLEEYFSKNKPHFGGIIGRYANRIANGQFLIDGKIFKVAKNADLHHLHGGKKGFDQQIWDAEIIEKNGQQSLELTYFSKDGEENYPGNLICTVTYIFAKNNELIIDYQAITDKKTIINLTNHAYFNLKDGGQSSILYHRLKIYADRFTPIDETSLPTGEMLSVEQTPFDFRNFKPIGNDVVGKDKQLSIGNGYDHNFVLNSSKKQLRTAAEVVELVTGRTLTVLTTKPGVQLYTGNWLDDLGKVGIHYQKRSAFCLETQHFPNSPNQSNFPSTILDVGEQHRSTTIYRFGVQKLVN